jgi:hypothetical protein
VGELFLGVGLAASVGSDSGKVRSGDKPGAEVGFDVPFVGEAGGGAPDCPESGCCDCVPPAFDPGFSLDVEEDGGFDWGELLPCWAVAPIATITTRTDNLLLIFLFYFGNGRMAIIDH